jgi:hypothetical protein
MLVKLNKIAGIHNKEVKAVASAQKRVGSDQGLARLGRVGSV